MIVHDDCRHFRGDRPCDPHKREGYRTACDVAYTGMERIPAGEVFRAVRELL